MATLQNTTSPSLSATDTITSPIMRLDSSSSDMPSTIEYAGWIAIANGASVDLICNTSGAQRIVGLCNFFNYSSCSWFYGMFEFDVSNYGIIHTPILSNMIYKTYHYQEPSNSSRSWLRFANQSGCDGIQFHFNIRLLNTSTYDSSILTRIK